MHKHKTQDKEKHIISVFVQGASQVSIIARTSLRWGAGKEGRTRIIHNGMMKYVQSLFSGFVV